MGIAMYIGWNCTGRSCVWWELSGWILSQVGNLIGWNCPRVEIVRMDFVPGWKFHRLKLSQDGNCSGGEVACSGVLL